MGNEGNVGGRSAAPVEGREAGHRLDHRPEPRAIPIRAVLAPAGDAREDQAGILRGQRVPAESPFLERAGQEVLDQHVGLTAEPPQERLPSCVGQIQGDRALAAGVDLPPELAAIPEPGAQRIAAPWILDLDDVGAVVAQDGRQDAPRDQAGAVDDSETGERAAHFWWGDVLK
jgi:hypothetical protein